MPRAIPPHRFDDLLRVAQETFIAQGYARTQMDDVAKALGVGKGTIYGYVESKQALFDFVIRNGMRPGPVAVPDVLPLATPAPGATLRAVEARIADEGRMPRLRAAAAGSGAESDVRAELVEVVLELYDTLYRNRVGIKLLERCSRDYPELHEVWHGAGRYAVVDLLDAYLRRAIASGGFAPVPDVRVAARFVLETVTTWAVHIHWDAAPDDIDEALARETVVHFLTRTLCGGS